MIDRDDLPGYLIDAYQTAIDQGLQSLNLTRIGGGANKGWQCSSRFTRSSGFHVHIEADPFEALMGALGAWTRIGAPIKPTPEPAGDPREDMTLADRQDPREVYDGVTAADLAWASKMREHEAAEGGLFD